jgi:hypothetical protein
LTQYLQGFMERCFARRNGVNQLTPCRLQRVAAGQNGCRLRVLLRAQLVGQCAHARHALGLGCMYVRGKAGKVFTQLIALVLVAAHVRHLCHSHLLGHKRVRLVCLAHKHVQRLLLR